MKCLLFTYSTTAGEANFCLSVRSILKIQKSLCFERDGKNAETQECLVHEEKFIDDWTKAS